MVRIVSDHQHPSFDDNHLFNEKLNNNDDCSDRYFIRFFLSGVDLNQAHFVTEAIPRAEAIMSTTTAVLVTDSCILWKIVVQ